MTDQLQAAFGALLALLGLSSPANVAYQGYVEGEYVLVGPQIAGNLETLDVARGQTVRQGTSLFTQEHDSERATADQALATIAHAESALIDLIKARRPPELAGLVAQRDQAEAALRLATITYERDLKQLKAKAVSQATVDADKAAMDQAKGRLAEAEAGLATGHLSVGRDDAIRAAQADVEASKAAFAEAQWKLEQKRVLAPDNAFVFDTLYRPGEYVPVGQPVVSLLPSKNIKVRFFVPEKDLSAIKTGQPVQIHIDGEADARAAHVTYMSPKAEYSPPELYNRGNRERLLFMIEATPDAAPEAFHPGQPVDVTLAQP